MLATSERQGSIWEPLEGALEDTPTGSLSLFILYQRNLIRERTMVYMVKKSLLDESLRETKRCFAASHEVEGKMGGHLLYISSVRSFHFRLILRRWGSGWSLKTGNVCLKTGTEHFSLGLYFTQEVANKTEVWLPRENLAKRSQLWDWTCCDRGTRKRNQSDSLQQMGLAQLSRKVSNAWDHPWTETHYIS